MATTSAPTSNRRPEKMGECVVPALNKALAGDPSLETKKRLQDLRKQVSGVVLSGARLRADRAVEILERIGTPEARHLLQVLADGAQEALVTTTAREALARLVQLK